MGNDDASVWDSSIDIFVTPDPIRDPSIDIFVTPDPIRDPSIDICVTRGLYGTPQSSYRDSRPYKAMLHKTHYVRFQLCPVLKRLRGVPSVRCACVRRSPTSMYDEWMAAQNDSSAKAEEDVVSMAIDSCRRVKSKILATVKMAKANQPPICARP